MKTIQLTQGKVALVDDADFEKVNAHKWYAKLDKRGRWYAQRNVRLADGKQTAQHMSRFIIGLEFGDSLEVDHKNREATLDNRRKNLRVTLDQNSQNVGKYKTNKSGFKGVSWNKRDHKWRVKIAHRERQIHSGVFDCPVAAAAVYNYLAKNLHGEFAVLNDLSNVTVADLGKKSQFAVAEMEMAA
jgi:hypothetical protein